MKITKKFLDEVAKQHNKDYPKEYWENGGVVSRKKRACNSDCEYATPGAKCNCECKGKSHGARFYE